MKEFSISIRSFQEVMDFVSLATVQPFQILVGNDRSRVSAKSFMGMFCLDYSEPQKVRMDCGAEDFQQFRLAAARFAVD